MPRFIEKSLKDECLSCGNETFTGTYTDKGILLEIICDECGTMSTIPYDNEGDYIPE